MAHLSGGLGDQPPRKPAAPRPTRNVWRGFIDLT